MKPYKRGPVYAFLGPHQHALAKKISVLSKPQIHAHKKRMIKTEQIKGRIQPKL